MLSTMNPEDTTQSTWALSFKDNSNTHVVRKLGYGGLATAWLCRVLGEKPRSVAVKILMERLSGDYCPELHGVKPLRDAGLTEENHKGLFLSAH